MKLDVEIFEDYGPGRWAQNKYLVHLYDDVLWTDDIEQVLGALRESLEGLAKP